MGAGGRPPQGGSRSYVLYFSARRKDGDEQCIGTATASSPAGPFVPLEDGPLVCPLDLGGAIDAASYIETDGTRYLLYKSDEQKTAAIYLVRLSPDGLRLAGTPKRIMGRGADEPVLVEAPELIRRGNEYVLLYSAGWYFEAAYQTRYAVAPSIEGPYERRVRCSPPPCTVERSRGRGAWTPSATRPATIWPSTGSSTTTAVPG